MVPGDGQTTVQRVHGWGERDLVPEASGDLLKQRCALDLEERSETTSFRASETSFEVASGGRPEPAVVFHAQVEARDRALAARVQALETELSAGAQSTLARRLGELERLEREAAKTAHGTVLVDGGKGPKRDLLTTHHEKILESKINRGTKHIVRRATSNHRRSVSGSFALFVVLALQAAGAFTLYTVYAKFKRAKLL